MSCNQIEDKPAFLPQICTLIVCALNAEEMLSLTWYVVVIMADLMAMGDISGYLSIMRAAMPATCGVAVLVPGSRDGIDVTQDHVVQVI